MANCKWGFYVFLHRKVAIKQVFLLLIGKGIYEGCLPTEIKAFIVDHNTSKGRPIISFAVLYLMVKIMVCGHRIVNIETP